MNTPSYNQQSGMALIISLIILISMTILGVASMQATRTEVSMAGNQREAGLSFNATEAGLSAAERYIEDSISKTAYNDPAIGLYDRLETDPETTLPFVTEQPRFIIKYLGDRSQNEVAAVNIGGYGSSQPGKTVSNFRVTSRGVGQTANSFRFIQSYYGKEF
jgi:type IV pilus assembly protein PilX